MIQAAAEKTGQVVVIWLRPKWQRTTLAPAWKIVFIGLRMSTESLLKQARFLWLGFGRLRCPIGGFFKTRPARVVRPVLLRPPCTPSCPTWADGRERLTMGTLGALQRLEVSPLLRPQCTPLEKDPFRPPLNP